MISCAIIGDSIAAGVAQIRGECTAMAVVGITSMSWNHRYPHAISAREVLISLGSNDGNSPGSEAAMRQIRGRFADSRVTWLLSPNNPRTNSIASRIAAENGDRTIEVSMVHRPDRVHPTASGYRQLANDWRASP